MLPYRTSRKLQKVTNMSARKVHSKSLLTYTWSPLECLERCLAGGGRRAAFRADRHGYGRGGGWIGFWHRGWPIDRPQWTSLSYECECITLVMNSGGRKHRRRKPKKMLTAIGITAASEFLKIHVDTVHRTIFFYLFLKGKKNGTTTPRRCGFQQLRTKKNPTQHSSAIAAESYGQLGDNS